jgi:hypothetical protein
MVGIKIFWLSDRVLLIWQWATENILTDNVIVCSWWRTLLAVWSSLTFVCFTECSARCLQWFYQLTVLVNNACVNVKWHLSADHWEGWSASAILCNADITFCARLTWYISVWSVQCCTKVNTVCEMPSHLSLSAVK